VDSLQVIDGGRTLTAIQQIRCISYYEHIWQRTTGDVPQGVIAPNSDRLLMQGTHFGSGAEGDSVWGRAVEQYHWLRDVAWVESRSVETLFFGRIDTVERHYEALIASRRAEMEIRRG
jgi:hypothetical protein